MSTVVILGRKRELSLPDDERIEWGRPDLLLQVTIVVKLSICCDTSFLLCVRSLIAIDLRGVCKSESSLKPESLYLGCFHLGLCT